MLICMPICLTNSMSNASYTLGHVLFLPCRYKKHSIASTRRERSNSECGQACRLLSPKSAERRLGVTICENHVLYSFSIRSVKMLFNNISDQGNIGTNMDHTVKWRLIVLFVRASQIASHAVLARYRRLQADRPTLSTLAGRADNIPI